MITLSDEQAMLQDMANGWVSNRAPVTALRAVRREHRASGYNPALYAEMAEMGWPAIMVPEEQGGVGMDLTSLGLIARELGRKLVASPLVPTAAGAVAALVSGSNEDARNEYLPGIATGDLVAALAIDDGNHHRPDAIQATACRDGDGWVLSGVKCAVAEASAAQLLILAAKIDGEDGVEAAALFACDPRAAGVTVEPLMQIDSRGAADVTFSSVALTGSALLGVGSEYLDRVLDCTRAILAAEMLGGIEQAFDTTVEYTKTRIQFDQPIGSFQALQHRMAEMLGEITLVRAAVFGALTALDENTADAPRKVSLAKAMAGDCFRAMAREMIQLHGGIGMTDEHDAGLYLKRAHIIDHMLGNAAFHRERFARFLEI